MLGELMHFTIKADRQTTSTYARRKTAREALFLASSRVQDGAERVMVYDEREQFVGSTALALLAREEIGAVNAVQKAVDAAVAELLTLEPQPYTPTDGIRIDVPTRLNSEPAATKPDDVETNAVPRSRVRVFRAGGNSS